MGITTRYAYNRFFHLNDDVCSVSDSTWVIGLDILKFDKNSTDLKCFIFQFAGLGGLFGGAKPTKDPHGDGNVLVMEAFSLY